MGNRVHRQTQSNMERRTRRDLEEKDMERSGEWEMREWKWEVWKIFSHGKDVGKVEEQRYWYQP